MILTCSVFMKRELLGFSVVEEFPKDSRRTFAPIICCASCADFDPQKNFSRIFEVSVLPEPDSPAMTIDCGLSNVHMLLLTSLAVED